MAYELEQQQLADRLRRAQLLQQDQIPQGQMVSGHYVNPSITQYLAQGLRQYLGGKEQDAVQQEQKALAGRREQAIADALRGFTEKSQGQPADVLAEGLAGPVRPAQAPDMQGAFAQLMAAPDPTLRQAGMRGIVEMPQIQAQAEQRKADLAFRQEESAANRQARMDQLAFAHQQRMEAMAAQNASREQMAAEQREFQREMAKMRQSMAGANAQPYYQPVQTAQGVMAFNARTGKMEPVVGPNGVPVVGAAADPSLQGALAGAKAGATTEAKSRTEARLGAPQAIAQGEETIRLVDDLLKAPGMKQAVGASRMLGIQNIPGTAAKDFDVRLDQLKGQQFLQAFESLKGGGQITEVEGKKATDAIARMNAASSESEFVKASREFQSIIREGVNRAKKAQGSAPAGQQPSTGRIRFDAQGNVIP